jgi:hypothetical protein
MAESARFHGLADLENYASLQLRLLAVAFNLVLCVRNKNLSRGKFMLVKVVNDNVHPYSEKFKGVQIHIPPKGFIEMDWNEASDFLGTMPGNLEVDANGIQKPTSYKMLRIERGPTKVEAKEQFICMACNQDLVNKNALDAHIESEHMDEMVDLDAKEKITKRRGRPSKGVKDDAGTD